MGLWIQLKHGVALKCDYVSGPGILVSTVLILHILVLSILAVDNIHNRQSSVAFRATTTCIYATKTYYTQLFFTGDIDMVLCSA